LAVTGRVKLKLGVGPTFWNKVREQRVGASKILVPCRLEKLATFGLGQHVVPLPTKKIDLSYQQAYEMCEMPDEPEGCRA